MTSFSIFREPEETREHGEEDVLEDYSALPAPVGVSDSWAEPAASSVPAGFGNVEGFEAVGEWMVMSGGDVQDVGWVWGLDGVRVYRGAATLG